MVKDTSTYQGLNTQTLSGLDTDPRPARQLGHAALKYFYCACVFIFRKDTVFKPWALNSSPKFLIQCNHQCTEGHKRCLAFHWGLQSEGNPIRVTTQCKDRRELLILLNCKHTTATSQCFKSCSVHQFLFGIQTLEVCIPLSTWFTFISSFTDGVSAIPQTVSPRTANIPHHQKAC